METWMVINLAPVGLACALALLCGQALAQEVVADAFHAPRLSADCIWRSLPQALREQIAVAQTLDDVSDLVTPLDAKGPQELRAIALRCGVPAHGAEPADVAQHLIFAKSLEIWSVNQLKAAYGIDDATLARAYAAATPEAKAEFAEWFIGNLDMSAAPMETIRPMVQAVGAADAEGTKLLLFYAASRALVEQMGGTG
jgi:hypothetical protein